MKYMLVLQQNNGQQLCRRLYMYTRVCLCGPVGTSNDSEERGRKNVPLALPVSRIAIYVHMYVCKFSSDWSRQCQKNRRKLQWKQRLLLLLFNLNLHY